MNTYTRKVHITNKLLDSCRFQAMVHSYIDDTTSNLIAEVVLRSMPGPEQRIAFMELAPVADFLSGLGRFGRVVRWLSRSRYTRWIVPAELRSWLEKATTVHTPRTILIPEDVEESIRMQMFMVRRSGREPKAILCSGDALCDLTGTYRWGDQLPPAERLESTYMGIPLLIVPMLRGKIVIVA